MRRLWLPRRFRSRAGTDPDHLVTRKAARRIALRVAVLSALMVLAGVFTLTAYLWWDSHNGQDYGFGHDTLVVAIDPEDVVPVILVVGAGAIVFAGLGALLFAGQAVKPLEESMRRQRNFIGDASHELRTPLAVLDARIQQAQLMAEDCPEIQPVLGELREDSEAMILIVNDLLSSVSNRVVDFDPTDLQAAIMQVRAEMSVVANTAGCKLIGTSLPGGRSVLVEVPEVPLKRSLVALIDNAIGHTEPGGVVQVETFPQGRWQIVRVIDQGHGITGIHPDRIFDRFSGGTTVKDGREVTRPSHGIGLSLVHDVVTRYGGSVEVEQTGTNGTTFRLRLPSAK